MLLSRFFFLASLLFLSSFLIASAIDYSQGSQVQVGNSVADKKEKPLHIGVEGRILCKSASSTVPIQGAFARVSCVAVDRYGYETAPFSFLSGATDASGYFLATLAPSDIHENRQVRQCKAFLGNSLLENCKFPTDENNGIRGAHLNSYRVLTQRQMKLYWIQPFFYTSQPANNTLPHGYN